MIEIYSRLHIKPEHPRAGVMLDQLRQLQRNQRQIELENLLNTPAHKRHTVKRKAINFFKDLNFFLDLCLAYWIVRRELRHNKRAGKRQSA